MRVGVKVSTPQPLSAQHPESTMFQPWRIYPSILQTLVNCQLHQSSMKTTHSKIQMLQFHMPLISVHQFQ